MPTFDRNEFPEEESPSQDSAIPAIDAMSGVVTFEFYDMASGQTFRYEVERAELARASRAVSPRPDRSAVKGERVSEDAIRREQDESKSWSNGKDNRTRRAIADGYADTDKIYQRLADYGGCSATVLSATRTRMVALTAAHCVFLGSGSVSNSKVRPRRNGTVSPTWGSWSVISYSYFGAFLEKGCDDNYEAACFALDIALVVASPDSDATPPMGMGWGYGNETYLNGVDKYRRGYPDCSSPHSPSSCSSNTLYGDGAMSVGGFWDQDADGWHQHLRHSSDTNPGDSGSGLYFYEDGFPYVFAVNTSEPGYCNKDCFTEDRPNRARTITPQWFDFINSVVD